MQICWSFDIFVLVNVSSINYSLVNQLTRELAETYIKHNNAAYPGIFDWALNFESTYIGIVWDQYWYNCIQYYNRVSVFYLEIMEWKKNVFSFTHYTISSWSP